MHLNTNIFVLGANFVRGKKKEEEEREMSMITMMIMVMAVVSVKQGRTKTYWFMLLRTGQNAGRHILNYKNGQGKMMGKSTHKPPL